MKAARAAGLSPRSATLPAHLWLQVTVLLAQRDARPAGCSGSCSRFSFLPTTVRTRCSLVQRGWGSQSRPLTLHGLEGPGLGMGGCRPVVMHAPCPPKTSQHLSLQRPAMHYPAPHPEPTASHTTPKCTRPEGGWARTTLLEQTGLSSPSRGAGRWA